VIRKKRRFKQMTKVSLKRKEKKVQCDQENHFNSDTFGRICSYREYGTFLFHDADVCNPNWGLQRDYHIKKKLFKRKGNRVQHMVELVFLYCGRPLHLLSVILIRNFQDLIHHNNFMGLITVLRYKKIIFYTLYIIGFTLFVMTLKKGFLRYQIRLFFWTHCVLIFTFGVSLATLTVYEGMIWAILSIILGKLNKSPLMISSLTFSESYLVSINSLLCHLIRLGRDLLEVSLLQFSSQW
jgi:hypothetical protein